MAGSGPGYDALAVRHIKPVMPVLDTGIHEKLTGICHTALIFYDPLTLTLSP